MDEYTNLAKQAVEAFIRQGKVIVLPNGLSKKILEKKAGVFVTIEKREKGEQKELRGCIGTYLPTKENIAEEIIRNAVAAATQDYRFGAIEESELPYLSYTVYILGAPLQIKDIKELDPKKYGILIKTTGFPLKSALLLPDLEGIDTIEKQIAIACRKGGINAENDKIVIYKFSVEKHS